MLAFDDKGFLMIGRVSPRGFGRLITLVAASCGIGAPLHAQLQAVATFTATQLTATTYHYEIFLKNTGTTTIGTFWFSWVPGQDFMPSPPTNIGAPLSWNGVTTHGGASDGYGIQWTTPYPAYDLPAGQSFTGFNFNSTMTPTQLMAGLVATSYVFIGAPQSDPGYSFAVTNGTSSAPQLTVGVSHIGNFTQGQPAAAYAITVANSGSGPGSGTVTVTDNLPAAGFTVANMAGTGWNCVVPSVICTRIDALPAGGSYPPITLTVNVPLGASSPAINQVNLAGGGSAAISATDTATILPPFVDVSSNDVFLAAVDLLREYAITNGCGASPPTFCPSSDITRGDMAVLVVRSIIGSDNFTYSLAPYFADVPSSHPEFPWVQKMRDLGITAGCGTNIYCPNDAVTRGQMAVFIVRARFGATAGFTYPLTPLFTDVGTDNAYFAWIQKMKQLGITSGCGPGTYCPNDSVTREEMAAFLMRGAFNQLLAPGTPVVSSVSPSSVPPGYTVVVTLIGQNTNWVNGVTQVGTAPGITAGNVVVTNASTLTVQLTVAPNATPGPYSLTATTGTEEATLPNGFIVQ